MLNQHFLLMLSQHSLWKLEMEDNIVRHRGRRFRRAPDKINATSPVQSILPPPTPPSGKSRDCIDASFSHKRFKPLPSIGSRDAVVERDSVVHPRPRLSEHLSSHMTGSHDHLPHVHKLTTTSYEELTTVPPEPSPHDPHTVTLCIRLPDGTRVQRRFNHSAHTLRAVLAFAMTSLPQDVQGQLSEVELASSTVPKEVYSDWSLTLGQAGLTRNTLLCLSIL